MYELHAWCGLAESPHDINEGGLATAVAELQERVAAVTWPSVSIDLRPVNGQSFITVLCYANRRREEATFIDDLFANIASRLPGSWGLVHDRDDEMPEPYGPNRFRVRVLARGTLVEADDPFLSPARPVIED